MPLPKIAIIRNVEAQKISLPRYGNPVGTSMTLLSANADSIKIAPNHYEIIETGLAIALPVGVEAQIRSLKESTKTAVFVLNAPVTIDASDRKDIKVCLYNASNESVIIKYSDPIALLVFSPALRVEWDDMTHKHQIQANQTDAFVQRTQYETEEVTSVSEEPDEFEPVDVPEVNVEVPEESETASDQSEVSSGVNNVTEGNDGIPVLYDTEYNKEIKEAPVQNEVPPVEPPAIIKEFEETENDSSDVQEDGEKNEI